MPHDFRCLKTVRVGRVEFDLAWHSLKPAERCVIPLESDPDCLTLWDWEHHCLLVRTADVPGYQWAAFQPDPVG